MKIGSKVSVKNDGMYETCCFDGRMMTLTTDMIGEIVTESERPLDYPDFFVKFPGHELSAVISQHALIERRFDASNEKQKNSRININRK